MAAPDHRLAIMASFRYETKFLREWIEYHRLVGVEKFFLLCNDDDQETPKAMAVLRPYIKGGQVECRPYRTTEPDWQPGAWKLLQDTWGHRARWCAMIDLDEFLFPVRQGSILPTLDRLEKRRAVAGLGVYSCVFGGYYLKKSPTLQTQELLRRAPLSHPINWTAKFIFRMDRMQTTGKGYRQPRPGFEIVDTRGTRVVGRRQGPLDELRLNHYSVRSVEDWETKLRRGWPEAAVQWTDKKHLHTDHKLATLERSEESDASMQRFGKPLRVALGMKP